MRPDGYGLLRAGPHEFGFFVEFDRGTVHPAALRAKFAAYHRYMSRPQAALEYDGFPTLLVVASGPASEQRVVEAVRAISALEGGSLSVLVTTMGWLESDSGWFGKRVWLEPRRQMRRGWPIASPEGRDKQRR
jgi:hypothetical protein